MRVLFACRCCTAAPFLLCANGLAKVDVPVFLQIPLRCWVEMIFVFVAQGVDFGFHQFALLLQGLLMVGPAELLVAC